MDAYTEETRAWLDRRFRQVDADGVYYAHQPIYGFRAGHAEGWPTVRYAITWQILRALAHLRFTSLLDVGGAEGYKAALIRDVFGGEAWSCDLSEEACRRARSLYGIPGRAVDIHALPFEDSRFDVVLCSETLEHVARIEDATRELLRVARRAVIITVPREPVEVVERNIREKLTHAHIHALRPHSFDFTRPTARRILVRRMLSSPLGFAFPFADAMPKPESDHVGKGVLQLYNRMLPLVRGVVGEGAVAALLALDDRIANTGLPYQGLRFVLLKDESAWSERPLRAVGARRVLDFHVPLHRPDNPYVPGESAAATGAC
jgi:ubiquinone/menaquinone biosynthesis C-methylase UbiE